MHPAPIAIANEHDVHFCSNTWCSFPSRRSATNATGPGAAAGGAPSGTADACSAVTDAQSVASDRTVARAGEDLAYDITLHTARLCKDGHDSVAIPGTFCDTQRLLRDGRGLWPAGRDARFHLLLFPARRTSISFRIPSTMARTTISPFCRVARVASP